MGAIAELTGDSSVGVWPSPRGLRSSAARGLIEARVTQPARPQRGITALATTATPTPLVLFTGVFPTAATVVTTMMFPASAGSISAVFTRNTIQDTPSSTRVSRQPSGASVLDTRSTESRLRYLSFAIRFRDCA